MSMPEGPGGKCCQGWAYYAARMAGLSDGECRSRPPSMESGNSRWPVVAWFRWCGAFKPRQPHAVAVLAANALPSEWVDFPAGTLTLTFTGSYRGPFVVQRRDGTSEIELGVSDHAHADRAIPWGGGTLRVMAAVAESDDGEGTATLSGQAVPMGAAHVGAAPEAA